MNEGLGQRKFASRQDFFRMGRNKLHKDTNHRIFSLVRIDYRDEIGDALS